MTKAREAYAIEKAESAARLAYDEPKKTLSLPAAASDASLKSRPQMQSLNRKDPYLYPVHKYPVNNVADINKFLNQEFRQAQLRQRAPRRFSRKRN
jgi:hypothetical protein